MPKQHIVPVTAPPFEDTWPHALVPQAGGARPIQTHTRLYRTLRHCSISALLQQ